MPKQVRNFLLFVNSIRCQLSANLIQIYKYIVLACLKIPQYYYDQLICSDKQEGCFTENSMVFNELVLRSILRGQWVQVLVSPLGVEA